MSQLVCQHTLSGDVASPAGTFVVPYPAGTSTADVTGGVAHSIVIGQEIYRSPTHFAVAVGATGATVTWRGGFTLPSGTALTLGLDTGGSRNPLGPDVIASAYPVGVYSVRLGTPIALDADGLIVAATGAELPNPGATPARASVTYTAASSAGASPVDGANQTWVLDVPRNVTAAAAHASAVVAMTITVRGLDVFGRPMTEELAIAAGGTSQAAAGVKAFARVTSVTVAAAASAEGNTLDLGWGNVLGLPVYVPAAGSVLAALQDGAAPSNAGTLAAGLSPATASTATTADVRGTYAPNANAANVPNGSRAYELLVVVRDPVFRGNPQFAG